MNYTILAIGETKEEFYRKAIEEYQKRMQIWGGLEEKYLKPAKTPGRELSPDEIRLALEKEGEEFRRVLEQPRFARCYKIALCIEGKQLSSEKLAHLFENAAINGKSGIVFLIGGSWGIAESVKNLCDFRLSFSPMTFPHSLANVMLAEQIYRAAGINMGSQYHK